MRIGMLGVLLGAVACAGSRPADASRSQPALKLPRTPLTADQQALHVLNRLAYGPSPADLAWVKKVGVAAWITAQLSPTEIPDPAVDDKLKYFRTLSMTTEQQLAEFMPPRRLAKQQGLDLGKPEDREKMMEQLNPYETPRQLGIELSGARMIRAVESRRQLEEVLLDFWFNHFNVSEDKGPVKWMVTSYERDALRPHLHGSFRALLGAVAHHPAMLMYLDNWSSTREGMAKKNGNGSGLNENYARELMELHTLGVNGGYTQEDVHEVARCFTGWSIEKPREVAEYRFKQKTHDPGEKKVLGHTFPAGGAEDDGERVLDLLAEAPATAHFIAEKLARKFVADVPPPSVVENVARVFRETHGNLSAVYVALFTSPEFFSAAAYRAKTKTPLELAVSAVRSLGGTTAGDVALTQRIGQMGEALYRAQPPTGYPENAEPWVNAGALVSRINFGLALAANRIRGTEVQLPAVPPEPTGSVRSSLVESLARQVLHEPLSAETRVTLEHALAEKDGPKMEDGERRKVDSRQLVGLLLGSPEFQKQ